jgi:hypothetical protein
VCVCSLSCPACNVHAPYYIVICGLSGCTIFPHYLISGTVSGKKLLNIKFAFWFYLKIFCEIFLILRRIQRDINVLRSSRKVPVILVRFDWKVNVLDRLSKNTEIWNFMKIRPVGAELFHAGHRQADRRTVMKKLIVAFRNFANAPRSVLHLLSQTLRRAVSDKLAVRWCYQNVLVIKKYSVILYKIDEILIWAYFMLSSVAQIFLSGCTNKFDIYLENTHLHTFVHVRRLSKFVKR